MKLTISKIIPRKTSFRLSKNKIEELQNATERQVKAFSFNGLKKLCKVTHVHDGDTCRIIFYYNKELIRLTIRLDGIYTPELHSSNLEEVQAAYNAKNRLAGLILNKIIYVELGKNDKYKRPLADLYITDDKCIHPLEKVQDILVKEGFAIKYSGKTKIPYSQWKDT